LYSGRCNEELIFYFAKISIFVNSVADPRFISRIADPDFYPTRVPDPKTATKEKGEKIVGPIYKELYNFLPKKLSVSSQKYGLRSKRRIRISNTVCKE
jgi:hypothetical protein